MSEVLFLVDHLGGKISKATGELATYAKSIGDSVAVVFAQSADEITSQLKVFAVDKVITVAGEWDKYGFGCNCKSCGRCRINKKN